MSKYNIPRLLALTTLFLSGLVSVFGQETLKDCRIELQADVLSFKNSQFIIEYYWNNGDIRGNRITNLKTSHTWWLSDGSDQGLLVPDSIDPVNAELKVHRVVNHVLFPDHLVGEIITSYQHFEIQRTFRIYPNAAALEFTLSLKKKSDGFLEGFSFDEKISLPGKQWKLKSVEFHDQTDSHNNLVHSKESIAFIKPVYLSGNILIANDLTNDERLFIVKQSPLGESQLLYPGSDFQVQWGEITIRNLGSLYAEVPNNRWFRCYGYTMGLGGSTDFETLWAIRDNMKRKRKKHGGSEEMIMLNTWGDRGQDGKISEVFALEEIQKGKELGITHLQLDDGWQQGLSKNSKSATGNLWDQWTEADWEPHDTRFPSGLGPVVKAASDLGIEIGLWFHPSNASSYASWKNDANIILDLYHKEGIKTFKIDGMKLNDKNADIHMRNIFDTAKLQSQGKISFNVDATADRRGGYFYLNEYGNIFLENRYTDWGNYYPHWTLRNLWQLSEYVPPEILQIEFLNNQRNPHKYDEKDPLRPSAIPFDYIFATSMAGQPLAFMESTGLPEEAFSINPTIEDYKKVMGAFHRGSIFPIGKEPDGSSWTGFQSISNEHSGYFLIFRENNEHTSFEIETYISGDQKVKLEKILGSGSNFDCMTGDNGQITFQLPGKFSYGLFYYEVESY